MTIIGIIGAGEVGSHIARAAIASGYEVVIANSRGPETLRGLIEELGPPARAATAAGAAAAGDFVVVAVPLKLVNDLPVDGLAGKVVLDTNNYMAWRDGHYPIVESGEKTEHELRQQQLPASKVVKAFTHIQAPRIVSWGRPSGSPERLAPAASSDFPEAVKLVKRLYDQFGFDTVDNSPLSESWRTRPGQPAWKQERQTLAELVTKRLFGPEAGQSAALRDPLRFHDVGRRIGRCADRADLALPHEIGEHRQRLLDIGVRCRPMDLVEVDIVDLESSKRALDRASEPAPRTAAPVRIVPHGLKCLGGEHDVVPSLLERFTDDLLGLALTIGVGAVDEVDAGIESPVHHTDAFVMIGIGDLPEHHRAQAIRADLDAGSAERAMVHVDLLDEGLAEFRQTA